MAFRWFRQNKNITRWLYIGVTVFVMVTFTVTGAMLDGLGDESAKELVGRFVTTGGKTVEVKAPEFRQLSYKLGRMYTGRAEEDAVWRFLMLDALAEEAGIVVGDEVRNRYIRSTLSQGGTGIQTPAQYKQFLQVVQLSERDFEALMRRQARMDIYQQLAEDPPRVLSEQVYERFKTENEEFQVGYVAFADESMLAALDAEAVSDEDLKKFYEEEIDPVRKANDFFHPEKYGVDAAVLDVAAADVAAMVALLPENQREVDDVELQAVYDQDLDRWLIEDAGGEDGDDEDAGDEDGDVEDVEDVEKFRTLDEVRAELEKEIFVQRLINAAVNEYNTAKFERDREAAAAAAAAAEEGSEGDESNPEETENETETEEEDEDLLVMIAGKYGLELVDFGDPMERNALEDLDRIGGPDLIGLVGFLPEGGVRARHATAESAYAAVLRLKAKIAAEAKAFEDVKDALPEVWREETARKQAEEAAQAFWDALTEKARGDAKDEVEKLEKEATDLANTLIERDAVEDEATQEEIRDRELASVQPRIEAAIAPHRGAHFDAVAAEQGVTVETVDWFRKTYRSTGFYRDEAASPAKFLKAQFMVLATDIGGVVGPLNDAESETSLVARVTDRRFPPPEAMTLADRTQAEQQVRQEIDPDYWMRQFGRASSFDFETLSRELRLERFEPRRAEEDVEEEPAG